MYRTPHIAVSLLALLLVAGCGSGEIRHHVSGQVMFHGKPVPAGLIQFLPDVARGNQGPAGFANIENGRYDTARSGRGTGSGPHAVVISGYDGKPDPSGEQTHGAPLFPDHHTTADLSPTTTTLDFNLP